MNKLIYFVGDTHGISEAHEKLVYNPALKNTTSEDFVIVCGDFGLPFLTKDLIDWKLRQDKLKRDTNYTRCIRDINKKEYTLLFVDGNHDNHEYWNLQPVEEWHGGKVHKHPNIERCYHLMRGEIYDIEGYKIFTFGGALSIDKKYRTPGFDWWEQEEASVAETEYAIENLNKHDNKVDIIVTHTIPQSLICKLDSIKGEMTDATAVFLDFVYCNIKYSNWVAGHFHQDKKLNGSNINVLYYDTKRVDEL